MASTNKFSSGLNKWISTDKPSRNDFVNDNTILDSFISMPVGMSGSSYAINANGWNFNSSRNRYEYLLAVQGVTLDSIILARVAGTDFGSVPFDGAEVITNNEITVFAQTQPTTTYNVIIAK